MPEILVNEQPAQTYQIPSFLAPKIPMEAPLAEPPKPEAQPADEAAATKVPDTEVKEETKAETQETTGKDPEKPEEAEKKATTRRFERRIDRAIRAKAEAEARAELLSRELQEIKAKQAPPHTEGEIPPRIEDFTDPQEYAKAYAAYETQKALKERDQSTAKERAERERAQLSQGWESQVLKATDKYEDFDEIVGELKPGLTPWGDAIMLTENGADVAYYLGQHEKEAERIFALSPRAQFVEIGRLAYKLSVTSEAPKKPSKAPPPIAPVSGTAETQEPAVSDPMPFEQYMKVGAKMFRGR